MRFLLAGLLACGNVVSVSGGQERDRSWLQGKCTGGEGAVVWEYGRADGNNESMIKMFEVSTGETEDIEAGYMPEFSPDASKLAWVKGSTVRGRLRAGDAAIHTIASGVTKNGGVHWISNTEVVVVKGGAWVTVHIGTGEETEVPDLTALGLGGTEIDVKLCDDGIWSRVSGTEWQTSDGQSGSTGGHCSSSLSPDGRSTTGLHQNHDECELRGIRSGGHSSMLQRTLADCSSKGFDNHRWSSNDPRFVAAQYECDSMFGVWERGTSDVFLAGDCTGESYGDFTNGPANDEPWPTGSPAGPEIVSERDLLEFSAVAGEGNPSSQSMTVSTEAGELLDVRADARPAWLMVDLSAASGREITVTNTADITGLPAGEYSGEVDISSANAGSVTYTVALSITEDARPPVLVVSPNGGETFAVGQTIRIAWDAVEDLLDRGVEIAVSVDDGLDWLVISGAKSVAPGDTSWEAFTWEIPDSVDGVSLVSTACRVRVEDYDEGTGRVDVSDGVFTIVGRGQPVRWHSPAGPSGAWAVSFRRNGSLTIVSGVLGPHVIAVYSPHGREVARLDASGPGQYASWAMLPSGVFLVRILANGNPVAGKAVMIR
ncbi:MAG: hypothetical protein GF410_04135 [Chitinivibrionales bacterium]|nr:hypothetical protein [Chitinivibrionales bacterium]